MRTIVLTVLGIAAFRLHTMAQTPNPYAAVAQRNVFGLKTPAMDIKDSPAPVVSVKLLGVADLFSDRQAIVRIGANDYLLHEGEMREGVKIVKIQTGGTVEMQNQGLKQVITNFGAPQ